MQSGVAPGWLVYGTVKWTDWSVLQNLTVITPLSTQIDQYQWRDGWTVTGGVGHAFNDMISGTMSLTWDRGVSTGWDLKGEVWTLALGASLKDKIGGEFRGGIGLSYLASVAETQYANAVIPGDIHSGFNQSTDNGYAISFNAGYSLHW
jgi:long-chain fatty acid transport protein